MDDLVYALLAPDLPAGPGSARPANLHRPRRKPNRKPMGFALQMVFGTLVNAVLHDGGPVRLQDPTLAAALARNFLASAGFAAPAAPAAPGVRAPAG